MRSGLPSTRSARPKRLPTKTTLHFGREIIKTRSTREAVLDLAKREKANLIILGSYLEGKYSGARLGAHDSGDRRGRKMRRAHRGRRKARHAARMKSRANSPHHRTEERMLDSRRSIVSSVAVAAIAALLAAASPAARADNTAPGDRGLRCRPLRRQRLHVRRCTFMRSRARLRKIACMQYWFMKPHFAKTLIQSGDGKGSGGVWAGGDQVSGHQGGFLSGFHLKIDLHDPRAISLRGITISEGLLQNVVHKYATTSGTLSQTAGWQDRRRADRSSRSQSRQSRGQRRHERANSVLLARDALAGPPDFLRRRPDRPRRNVTDSKRTSASRRTTSRSNRRLAVR